MMEEDESSKQPSVRRHQVIWAGSGSLWWNDITVLAIHKGPGDTDWGYAMVGQVMFLVERDINRSLPIWHIRGWVRTD